MGPAADAGAGGQVMTPQLIEALGIFIVLPICGAVVFWKLLDSYNQSATYEYPYR